MKSQLKINIKRNFLQLILITALIISSAKVDVFAQSSNPQPKMRLCKSDEVINSFSYNIFNKSNPRFIYMLNKETKDSLYFVQIDVTNLTIINRKTVPNNINYKTFPKPLSPDMKWCAYLHEGLDKQGCVIQSLDNPSIKKHLFDNKVFNGYDFDTTRKTIFLAYPTTKSGLLNGAIYSANYDNNDTGQVLINGVSGINFIYDYKRNHIITIDYQENPHGTGDGYRSLIQFFDASTGELVKQVIPYESEINQGEQANEMIYRVKMLKNNNKLCLYSTHSNGMRWILDLENYDLRKIKSYQKNEFNDLYAQTYFYNSDSLMVCNEYLNINKDSLRISVFNINNDKVYLDKIIRGEQQMNEWDLVVYMLENYNSFITWDPVTKGCIKIYDLKDLEDIVNEISKTETNEIENIFPNPTNGLVQINLSEINSPLNITISNLNGEIIKTLTNEAVLNNQINLNIQDLPTGSYFIRLQSASYLKTFKVMKGE